MTSKNALCPCGSQKQYKRCCGKESKGRTGKKETIEKRPLIPFADMVKRYNALQIVKFIGVLQLVPSNHGRNVRLEEMARLGLIASRKGLPYALWPDIKSAVEAFTDGIYLEDLPTTAFTENIVFAEGNYTVYPGISVSGSRILNELLECIFLVKNDLPDDFKKLVTDGVGLLLMLSTLVADSMNHDRNIFEPQVDNKIHVPEYDSFIKHAVSITFTREELENICGRLNYDISIIDEFIVDPSNPELLIDDPDNNKITLYPLMDYDGRIILYMPTTVVSSLIGFIYRKAEELSVYEKLQHHLSERQLVRSLSALKHLGWRELNIPLPEKSEDLPIHERVFQFDNQKYGYLCYVGRQPVTNFSVGTKPNTGNNGLFRRNESVIAELRKVCLTSQHEVLSLFILSETGQDFMFAWPKSEGANLSLILTPSELDTIAYEKRSNGLTLWKFAKTYHRTSDRMRVLSSGSTIDAYSWYTERNGSFLDGAYSNPAGGMMVIPTGYANDFLRRIHAERDEHAVIIFYKRMRAYAKVIRYKKFAPIYIEKEMLTVNEKKLFRLVIETYRMPIWVSHYFSSPGKDHPWAKILSESVTFWLHSMKTLLTPVLKPVTLIQFEIQILLDPRLSNKTYEIKEVDPASVNITVTIDAPRIKLFIPFDYIYIVQRADNLADKVLMKAVLQGLTDYVSEANGSILMDKVMIDSIVEKVLYNRGAKMSLFIDPTFDQRMDTKGLSTMRSIHDADESHVLEQLVTYLGPGYSIPATITSSDEKRKLCNDIVAALIQVIREKIEPFNGIELLVWLIKLNEKVIQVQLSEKIYRPARIACYSDFETELEEMADDDIRQVRSGRSLRTLVEFVAANPPVGERWPNHDEVEELMALTDQVITWGELSDAIWKKMDDPPMGLLPSGRILVGRSMEADALAPLHHARTTGTLFEYIEQFEKNYRQAYDNNENEGSVDEDLKKIDPPFQAETGFTMTQLYVFILILVEAGFAKSNPCMKLGEKTIRALIEKKYPGISPATQTLILDYLTLKCRSDIGTPQPDYPAHEIRPWRHKRSLSYLRRPMACISSGGENIYYFGYRHLLAFLSNLRSMLKEGKYPRATSAELKKFLGTVSKGKGNPFRTDVFNWFAMQPGLIAVPIEVDICEKGPLVADRDYGDIDVLVIDPHKKIIYSIECKNITGAKTAFEMWSEIENYLSDEIKNDDAKIIKHKKRHEWLQANRSLLSSYTDDPLTFEIKSFVITPEDIPLTYVRKYELPLPLRSFVLLRKNGISYLDDI